MMEGMSCEAVKPFFYRVSQLASQQTGTGRKDAENEHQGQNQLEKVFPSQANKTVFTGVCRAQRSAVDQLACQLPCPDVLFAAAYLAQLEQRHSQLASYRLSQYAQVKVRNLGSQIKLQYASSLDSTQHHSRASLGTQLASQLARYLAAQVRSPQLGYLQLATVPNLAWLFLAWSSQATVQLNRGVSGVLSQLLNSFQVSLATVYSFSLGLASLATLTGWYSAGYRVGTQCSCWLQSSSSSSIWSICLVQQFFFGLTLFLLTARSG